MARLSKAPQVTARSPRLLATLDTYISRLEVEDKSRNTIINYRTAVRQLAEASGNPPINEITTDDVVRYLEEIKRRYSVNTRANRHRALTTFFRWAVDANLTQASPMGKLKAPQPPQTEPPGFSADELRRLLAACTRKGVWGARDRAIVLTLYATGLRVSEFVALRVADVERRTASDRVIRVLGKGRKERSIGLGRLAKEAVAEYLLLRGEDDDDALWMGNRGPLGVGGIQMFLRDLGKRAGVEHCHPHRFRNTALSSMLDAGMLPSEVMRISGHTTEAMLRRYVGYSQDRRALEALEASRHVERTLGERPRRSKG